MNVGAVSPVDGIVRVEDRERRKNPAKHVPPVGPWEDMSASRSTNRSGGQDEYELRRIGAAGDGRLHARRTPVEGGTRGHPESVALVVANGVLFLDEVLTVRRGLGIVFGMVAIYLVASG